MMDNQSYPLGGAGGETGGWSPERHPRRSGMGSHDLADPVREHDRRDQGLTPWR